ncbi:hypothetical protein [Stagnimonas aquatica]|uniref:hypothetical protein n=1 Tax=Stagnimonas aquatica TaxID=2689987 RepID=UPI0011CD3768|nr:hypothetical protein [Stagnimonas aquatica]
MRLRTEWSQKSSFADKSVYPPLNGGKSRLSLPDSRPFVQAIVFAFVLEIHYNFETCHYVHACPGKVDKNFCTHRSQLLNSGLGERSRLASALAVSILIPPLTVTSICRVRALRL